MLTRARWFLGQPILVVETIFAIFSGNLHADKYEGGLSNNFISMYLAIELPVLPNHEELLVHLKVTLQIFVQSQPLDSPRDKRIQEAIRSVVSCKGQIIDSTP